MILQFLLGPYIKSSEDEMGFGMSVHLSFPFCPFKHLPCYVTFYITLEIELQVFNFIL